MKFTCRFTLFIPVLLLLCVQCKQDDYLTLETQKEVILQEFIDLVLNGNPLYKLYDTQELTLQECKNIILDLNRGKSLNQIFPSYLSAEVNLEEIYDFLYQVQHLANKLRSYPISEKVLFEKIDDHSIIRSKFKFSGIPQTRTSIGRIEYNRCVRYAEQDYEDCQDQAVRSGFKTWAGVATGAVAATWYTGSGAVAGLVIGGVFVGPVLGVMDYGHENRYCKQTLEKELLRCEEKWL